MRNRLFELRIYGHLTKMAFCSMAQYRADFWTSFIGVFVLNGVNIIQIGVITWKFKVIANWTAGDLMVLYGLFMISYSVYSIFFSRISELENEIVSGSFDKYLVKPISSFVQFMGGEIHYVGFCDTFLGMMLLVAGNAVNGAVWGITEHFGLAVFVICGGGIIVCIRLILSCAAFWFVKSNSLISILTQMFLLTQKYPAAIFGNVFKTIVTGIIPIAFMNYYPAVMLLQKEDAPGWLCMLSPVALLFLIMLAAVVWVRGVRRYGSAGG